MFATANSYSYPFYSTPSTGFSESAYAAPGAVPPANALCAEPQIRVSIKEEEKWERFHEIGNEMIVSKNGRNPFPIFDFDVEGLDRDAEYRFAIAFERCDDKRYTHQDGRWTTHGRGEPLGQPTFNCHHKDSQSGRHWMREGVRFHQLRFTNNVQSAKVQTIQLLSMHKYRALVHVYRVNPNPVFAPQLAAQFPFPTMDFIAVTAYQNGALKDLKVELNPFAKAFRKDGKHTTKRKAERKGDHEEEEDQPKKFRQEEEVCSPELFSGPNDQNFVPSPYQNNPPYSLVDPSYYENYQGYNHHYGGQMQPTPMEYYNSMYPQQQLQYYPEFQLQSKPAEE